MQKIQRLFSLLVGGVVAVGTVLAVAATSNFLNDFENFILFLAYFLVPWTAINLMDFYFVRREKYDIASIFDPKGIYGRIDWRTMVAYLVAIAVEVPFMNTTFYTGPMVSHLGGGDISWILGLIVAAGLYFLLHHSIRAGAEGTLATSTPGVAAERAS